MHITYRFTTASHFIHSFIPAISIGPLQVLYYSEALPTTARIGLLYRSFTPKRTDNCRYGTCPRSLYVAARAAIVLDMDGDLIRGTGGTVPKKIEGGDGPCISPPNISRRSVVGCVPKYELSRPKKGVVKDCFFINSGFSGQARVMWRKTFRHFISNVSMQIIFEPLVKCFLSTLALVR